MSDRRWLIVCEWRSQYHEQPVYWEPNQAGYTTDIGNAGRYSDASALAIAERMNDGGDRPVRLVPAPTLRRPVPPLPGYDGGDR